MDEILEVEPKSLAIHAGDCSLADDADEFFETCSTPGLVRFAFEHAQKSPGRNVVESGDQGLTYAQLARCVGNLARQLKASENWAPGARVAIIFKNSLEYIVGFLGTLAAGLVAVPLPYDMELGRLCKILKEIDPLRILTSAKWINKFRSLSPHWKVEFRDSCKVQADKVPNNLAAILFTSGSTGDPKGVMLSHGNLVANAQSIVEFLGITSTERAGVIVPFYHAMGNSILTSHLVAGATLVLGQSIMFPDVLLDKVELLKITSLSGVPELFQRLICHSSIKTRRLTTLRYMSVAGGRLPEPSVQLMRDQIAPAKFYVMYGQTEATARLAYIPPEDLHAKLGSIGRAIPGVTLQIVNEDGILDQSSRIGELRASGANIALGYWNDHEATLGTFRDGWLYTGDIGWMDDDGFVYLQGRRNDFLKRYGFRMHTREIDEFLLVKLPLCQSVTVAYPRSGEVGLAVFAKPLSGQALSREDLRQACIANLPRYLHPDYIEIVDDYPLTATMKIDQAALRERIVRCA